MLFYANGNSSDVEYEDGVLLFEKIKYVNGDEYLGETKNGLCDGAGAYSFANGDRYEGYFRDDQKHGGGTYFCANGDVFYGTWDNNVIEGKGKFVGHDGTIVEGYYHNGFLYHGLKKYANGKVYYGEFDDEGEQDGYGITKYPDGDLYHGEYVNGEKNGYGVYHYSTKERYCGQFKNDLINGFGVFEREDETYYGQFYNGKRDGYGVVFDSNGDFLGHGIWEQDNLIELIEDPNAFVGIEDSDLIYRFYLDNKLLIGLWNGSSELVEGIVKLSNGYMRIGTFKNFQSQGKALEVVPSNDQSMLCAITEYENGHRNGITVVYYKDGKVSKAEYLNDEFVEQYY